MSFLLLYSPQYGTSAPSGAENTVLSEVVGDGCAKTLCCPNLFGDEGANMLYCPKLCASGDPEKIFWSFLGTSSVFARLEPTRLGHYSTSGPSGAENAVLSMQHY